MKNCGIMKLWNFGIMELRNLGILEELWKELWGDFYGSQYKSEERNAKEKFKQLKEGILLFDDSFFSLSTLIENSTTDWQEPEWSESVRNPQYPTILPRAVQG